mmetsp:Transcript_27227/g.71752  ORF Transcript_27227/g.71752 Transcript_27227/m.71752 type:complete len:235 (+) Transcript_27227:380-1084(+)
MTLFLFDDEKSSWPVFWELTMKNRSCEEMMTSAKVVVSEREDHTIDSYMNIMGKFAHNWYLVLVDCQTSICPGVVEANITFFHPSSDGTPDACSGLPQTAIALKQAMLEGWHALSVEQILNVVGLSPFGVAALYIEFTVMLLLSLVLLLTGARAESGRKLFFWNVLFLTSSSGLCYLAMATGNGVLVLRQVGADPTWKMSDSLLAHPGTEEHPNPFYDHEVMMMVVVMVMVRRR